MGYIEDLRAIVGCRPLLLTGVGVVAFNRQKEVLLQKNADGKWGIPGGFMELGESAEETGRREVFEETGMEIGELKLIKVISGVKTYKKLLNQDEYYAVTILYVTRDIVGGKLVADGIETFEVGFFKGNDLPANLDILSANIINDCLE